MEDKMGLSKKLDEIFYLQPIFPGSNYDFPDFTNIDLDDIYESNEIYNFYKIKKNNGFISPRKLKIPSTIKDKTIVSIGEYGFEKLEQLTELRIDEGIKVIEPYAFADCKNLTTVFLPKSFVIGHKDSFFNTSIKDVYFAEGCKIANCRAFYDIEDVCIHIPKSVEDIEYPASNMIFNINKKNKNFKVENNCLIKNGLTIVAINDKDYIRIPDNITDIILEDEVYVTQDVLIFPEGVEYIGAFEGSYFYFNQKCDVCLPSTLEEIDDKIFKNIEKTTLKFLNKNETFYIYKNTIVKTRTLREIFDITRRKLEHVGLMKYFEIVYINDISEEKKTKDVKLNIFYNQGVEIINVVYTINVFELNYYISNDHEPFFGRLIYYLKNIVKKLKL